MNDPVIFTQSAVDKVYTLMQEENNFNLKLRVYVTGGGCSGFQYGFAFEEDVQEEDTVVVRKSQLIDQQQENDDAEGGGNQTVSLLIDPISFQYLAGAEIDYREDIEGAQFIIRNPNAKTTCGCGSSFST
ncbi:MAG: iron-sulfur cluster insertion protein ErpA [Gammaproteobacteria bacterium]|nr:iron-sulfur cluster insertion protein ErpA [Gammaproteobacteria bacterium]